MLKDAQRRRIVRPKYETAQPQRGALAPAQVCACGRRGQILQTVAGRNIDIFKKRDFEQVRGDFEKNGVVLAILDHIKVKTELGDELIGRLKV